MRRGEGRKCVGMCCDARLEEEEEEQRKREDSSGRVADLCNSRECSECI